jgi:hypothetical protein
MRRATAFEEMEDPDHALADAQKVTGAIWRDLGVDSDG